MKRPSVLSILLLLLSVPACVDVSLTPQGQWKTTMVPSSGVWSCEAHLQQTHLAAPDNEQVLAEEFAHYVQLIEQALVYRERTIEVGSRLKDQARPLSGADLQQLNEGMVAHLALRQELMRVAESHECWFDLAAQPHQSLPLRQQLEGVMLSLSAALVLYDNYLLAASLFEEDERLRRVLNDSNSGYGLGREIYTGISMSYDSSQNRARLRRAIAFYEGKIRELSPNDRAEPRMRYLTGLINQSPSYAMTKSVSAAYVLGRKLQLLERLSEDRLADIAKGGMNLFSMLFGNAVGLVETRKGKLFQRGDVKAELARCLRAGDILLEKTPFRLTDALIPGFWGHAALWIGTEAELRELGIWTHPLVTPHQQAIRNGAGVVEALRSGVAMNPLSRFLNIDDLAILRGRQMTDSARAAVILNAMRQLGKDYDFNFDVETSDRIVCSELIYVTYTGIEWPTTRTLGRATISPDQIAAKALPGGPLELVLIYRDGEHVNGKGEDQLKHLFGDMSAGIKKNASTWGLWWPVPGKHTFNRNNDVCPVGSIARKKASGVVLIFR